MEKDFSKCQCPKPGWCDLLQKEMTETPPNWQWCQGLDEEKRKQYHDKVNGKVRTIRKAIKASLVDVVNFVDDIPTPTSDYAVCVIPANDSAMELLDITRDSIKSYAKKCGADYIELTGDQHPDWPMANKWRLNKVASTYAKTLYLDCDVFIKDDSPNIFESTPDDKISAFDEFHTWKDKCRHEWINKEQEVIIRKVLDNECKNRYIKNGASQFPESMINGGVLVIPYRMAHYYKQPKDAYPRQWCFDQNYLTLVLPKDKLFKLDKNFNCSYTDLGFYINSKNAHFIHVNNLRKEPERRKALLESFKNSNPECRMIIHEDFSMSKRLHFCDQALKRQKATNIKLKEYKSQQESQDVGLDKVCILCLGHSDQQFNSIPNRPYLKKVNLNSLKCDEYSGNEWAESRAFLSTENLFPDNAEFYGFVTASWNQKYLPHAKIDDFENWENTPILLNSKPDDRVVLCADVYCWCNWINDATCPSIQFCVLKSLINPEVAPTIGRAFFRMFDLDVKMHKRVPYSNQQIFHKSLYFEWKKYLEDNDCLEKVSWFVKKLKGTMLKARSEEVQEYSNTRLEAYFMEMLNVAWYTNNEFKIISNTSRLDDWYSKNNMIHRAKTWS